MEDYKWITITVIAFFLALLWDIKKRDKDSQFSPKRFDPIFYIKDNWARLLMSLIFSTLLAVLFWLVSPDVFDIDQELSKWGILVYILIGAAPDLVIAYAKRKTKFLRPNEVDGYIRRDDYATGNPDPPKPPKPPKP